MPTLVFVSPLGHRRVCTATAGSTVMMIALVHGMEGLLGECGGSLACGTCHVYVEPSQLALLQAPDAMEQAMLDMTASERRPNSRLSCQISVSDALDGLVVHLPERQV